MSVHVRLVFPEQLVREPVVSRLAKRFDVEANIRRANVEEDSGWILCELDGNPAAIDEAIAWLNSTGVRVELQSDLLEG
jgi:ABC-type methionine transport system ATPase subunit